MEHVPTRISRGDYAVLLVALIEKCSKDFAVPYQLSFVREVQDRLGELEREMTKNAINSSTRK